MQRKIWNIFGYLNLAALGISDFNANSFNGLTVQVPKNANRSAWRNS